MHIPTHQIHNVLNAYAKRLKKLHDVANGSIAETTENAINTYSVEEKRRLIMNKIASDIINRIGRSKRRPRPTPSKSTHHPDQPQNDLQTEQLRYHILKKNGEKVAATVRILDSDFLIKQLEEIARKESEK